MYYLILSMCQAYGPSLALFCGAMIMLRIVVTAFMGE